MNKKLSSFLSVLLIMQLVGCSQTGGTGEEASSTTSESATTSAAVENTTASATSDTTTAATSAPDNVQPDIWDPTVIQRQIFFDEGCICGVALLGYVDGEADADECRAALCDSVYAETAPELVDIPDSNIICTENGNELYLIVPTDVGASVAVNEYAFSEENDFMGGSGEVLYRSEYGSPVLIKCNFSDIMPSTIVNIVDSEGNALSWSPSVSLKDGSVSVSDGVYDMTSYIYNETYECYQLDY